jgi:ABC-2 type transport system permease protein
MRSALHAEWTKLRTVAAPWWLLFGLIVTTVAVGAAATSVVGPGSGDPTRLRLIGVELGQTPAAILAVLLLGGEYRTGLIRSTLTATPRRAHVVAAKAITLAGAVVVAGTIAVVGSLLFPPRPAPLAGVLRPAAGSVLYLLLIALLALGVAAVVRDSATSIGIVLGLLYLLPILAQVVGDPGWQRRLERLGPMTAGLAVQATTDLGSLPLSPWAGLGVTAGWAVAGLVTGGLMIAVRDA